MGEKFNRDAPWIMDQLMADFGLTVNAAAGIVGNAGHESGGFELLQEIKPRAGRGGYGWFQWTGPRRVAFEKFLSDNNLSATDREANYAFLKFELQTTEKRSLTAMAGVEDTIRDQTIAFENAFERSGVKNYPSRLAYAQQAYDAWQAKHRVANRAPMAPAGAAAATAGGAVAVGVGAAVWNFFGWVGLVVFLLIAAVVIYFISRLVQRVKGGGIAKNKAPRRSQEPPEVEN